METRTGHSCRSAREGAAFRRVAALATAVGILALIAPVSSALAGRPQGTTLGGAPGGSLSPTPSGACQGGFPPEYDDTERYRRFLDNQDRMKRQREPRGALETAWPWITAGGSVIVIIMWIVKRRGATALPGEEELPVLEDADEPEEIPGGEAPPPEDQTAGVRTTGPSFRLNVTAVEPLPGGEGLCVLRGRLKAGEPRPDDRLLASAAGAAGTATVVKVSSESAGSGPAGTLTCLLMRGLEPGSVKVGDVVLGEPRLLPASSFPQARLVSAPKAAPAVAVAVEILALKCPRCGKSLKVKSTAVGKVVNCPACKQPFKVER